MSQFVISILIWARAYVTKRDGVTQYVLESFTRDSSRIQRSRDMASGFTE